MRGKSDGFKFLKCHENNFIAENLEKHDLCWCRAKSIFCTQYLRVTGQMSKHSSTSIIFSNNHQVLSWL